MRARHQKSSAERPEQSAKWQRRDGVRFEFESREIRWPNGWIILLTRLTTNRDHEGCLDARWLGVSVVFTRIFNHVLLDKVQP